MTGHTRFERRLRHDIGAKNALRKKLEDRLNDIRRFEEKLANSRNHKWRKRYAASIDRLGGEIQVMRADLAIRNAELVGRIRDEMEYSKAEVESFKQSFDKERAEAIARREQYEKALAEQRKTEELLSDATAAESAEINLQLSKVIRRVRRLERQVEKEDKDVESVQRELDSEARDEARFRSELQRIFAENAHFGLIVD